MHTMPEGNMAPPRSWWSSNWKWAVPVGCLGMLASCGCLLFAGVFSIFSAGKDNPAYKESLALAQSDDEVQAVLGMPIEASPWKQQISLSWNNGRKSASFAIELDGTKADGVLRVEAFENGGEWQYQVLQVEVPGREPIDLRDRVGGGTQRELAPPTPDEPPQAGEEEEAPAEDGKDAQDGKHDINL